MSMPLPALIFRPVTTNDLLFLRDLYADTRANEMAQTAWDQEEIQRFLTLQFQLQHQYYQEHFASANFMMIEADGQPIGRLYWQASDSDGQLRIIDIALIAQKRAQGIGSRIIRDLMAQAAAGHKGVTLHVENYNPALVLYHRLGFKKTGSTGVYFRMAWHEHQAACTSLDIAR